MIYYGSITDTVITETSGGDRMAQQKLGQTRSDNVIKKEMIAMLLAGGQGSRLFRLATASIQALIQWVYLHSISRSGLTATSE